MLLLLLLKDLNISLEITRKGSFSTTKQTKTKNEEECPSLKLRYCNCSRFSCLGIRWILLNDSLLSIVHSYDLLRYSFFSFSFLI